MRSRGIPQVDEINTEDMADFTDSNRAESLRRLPGVLIDRVDGEGRTITLRGLGGDWRSAVSGSKLS